MRIALPAYIDPSAFADCTPHGAIGGLAGETMGTSWSVRFAARPGIDGARLKARIERRLADIVAQMSHWEPDSLLSRFNRARAGEWALLPPDFATVMEGGLAMAERTDGAFDPAIGALVNLWGFGPPGPGERLQASDSPDRPDRAKALVAEALACSGWRRLAYDAPARRLRQPGGLHLDLSGIAKGHAVDVIADLLGEAGVRHALVEIGGELVGRGVRPDGEPWWVELETLPEVESEPLRIALHGLAVATSGSYRRGLHSIDPRTGWPVDNGIVSLSVIAATALQADAWATALTVLGPEQGLDHATRHSVAARILVVREGRSREILTPALLAMLDD